MYAAIVLCSPGSPRVVSRQLDVRIAAPSRHDAPHVSSASPEHAGIVSDLDAMLKKDVDYVTSLLDKGPRPIKVAQELRRSSAYEWTVVRNPLDHFLIGFDTVEAVYGLAGFAKEEILQIARAATEVKVREDLPATVSEVKLHEDPTKTRVARAQAPEREGGDGGDEAAVLSV